MGDAVRAISKRKQEDAKSGSAGKALRTQLFEKITPLLTMTDSIEDSSTRLVIQAHCLDMVTTLEEVIERFELDNFPASVEC